MVFPHGRMKPPWIDPGSGELMALSLLASLGCVLALARRDLVFAIVFPRNRTADSWGDTTFTMRSSRAQSVVIRFLGVPWGQYQSVGSLCKFMS
jgi:hypothetical protein